MNNPVVFYLLAGLMISGALATVLVRNILHSALFLIGTFFTTAVLYLTLNAEFVAIAQVLVYIGGVVIFVLFTVLLTSHLGESALISDGFRKYLGVLLSGGFLMTTLWFVSRISEATTHHIVAPQDFASLPAIGERLLRADAQGFVLPFEIISLLLLVATIGAIVVARRDSQSSQEDQV